MPILLSLMLAPFFLQSPPAHASATPVAPQFESVPMADPWQAKIRSGQRDVAMKQLALENAVKRCDDCLAAQAALNSSTRALQSTVDEAARSEGCMNQIQDDLICKKAASVPKELSPKK